MALISKLQYEILENLFKRDVEKDSSISIHPDFYNLEEKDGIVKVRELVFNIDQLINLNFVKTANKYYIESDNMSFEYMNNAIEIIEDRINISPLGIQYIERLREGNIRRLAKDIKSLFKRNFQNHLSKTIASHMLSFIFGLFLMWLTLNIMGN